MRNKGVLYGLTWLRIGTTGGGMGLGLGKEALQNTPMKLRFYTTRENIYRFLK
jgi:hypothetical protein